jgi:membrane-associated protease RseP (regulator of RpoE activity)
MLPFVPTVRWSHRFAIRGAGLLFTFLLVVALVFFQTLREQRFVPRVKVAEGSAAAEGGVQTNDLITAVDGVAVDDLGELRELLLNGSGTSTLSLVRGGVTLERTVTLRDGLLGVQTSGEERAVTGGEALATSTRMLATFPIVYARVTWRALTVTAPPPTAAKPAMPAMPAKGTRTWLLVLNISLAFSWWLTLVVELGALGLGVFSSRGSLDRPRAPS